MKKILLMYIDGILLRKKQYVQEREHPKYLWFGVHTIVPKGSVVTIVWQDVYQGIDSADFDVDAEIIPGLICMFNAGKLEQAMLEDAPEHLRIGDAQSRLAGMKK